MKMIGPDRDRNLRVSFNIYQIVIGVLNASLHYSQGISEYGVSDYWAVHVHGALILCVEIYKRA